MNDSVTEFNKALRGLANSSGPSTTGFITFQQLTKAISESGLSLEDVECAAEQVAYSKTGNQTFAGLFITTEADITRGGSIVAAHKRRELQDIIDNDLEEENLCDTLLGPDLCEGMPFCREEIDIYERLNSAILHFEWVFYTTSYVDVFTRIQARRLKREDRLRRLRNHRFGLISVAPAAGFIDYVDPSYARFISHVAPIALNPETAILHNLQLANYASRTALGRLSLVNPGDSRSVERATTDLRFARANNLPYLSDLEQEILREYRATVGAKPAHLLKLGGDLIHKATAGQRSLWTMAACHALQGSQGAGEKEELNRRFNKAQSDLLKTVSATRMTCPDWRLTTYMLALGLCRVSACHTELLKRYNSLIERYSRILAKGASPDTDTALTIAFRVASNYDHTDDYSFGVLLTKALGKALCTEPVNLGA